ncbi:LysE/ArgO family amino acid transporter [Thorsellia kenyensis]|uniref:LysE/ArgO family amino acid transporter n=1 Tax=Thorsellia kenyensis TaxID=1549888 RepID=A0ABV6CBJ3_9GAMM
MAIWFEGFLLGLSLIVAIGSQNAFVLRQGLLGQHVLPVIICCALSDALLITIGVSGFYIVVEKYPLVIDITRVFGIVFLCAYAILRFISAYKATSFMELSSDSHKLPLKVVLGTCLAFTFLNPHVYLDTVILLGGIASQYKENAWLFGLGACFASVVFFTGLGFLAKFLRPFFINKKSWQYLDIFIGVVMFFIAGNLLLAF